jgi:integrase/recombinase XerD
MNAPEILRLPEGADTKLQIATGLFSSAPQIGAILEPPGALGGRDSLSGWVRLYWQVHVVSAPQKTMAAKRQDLARFVAFFAEAVGHDYLDGWTPAITRAFQTALHHTQSERTGKQLATTTVNRVLATVCHFGQWAHKQRPLLAGSPFASVKDRMIDIPSWNGLLAWQITRLKAACDVRKIACKRGDQAPLLKAAVFYTLLNTGLREHELVSLELGDYHHRGFHEVKRKGARVSKKVAVPLEAREALDAYVEKCRGQDSGPLFMAPRAKGRLTTRAVVYICERLAAQASAHVKNETGRFALTPHMLRHTFLKRVADKHGVHVAHTMSGNVSIREVFRYTKPSEDEMQETAEELFL